ncbi:hypothetical protein BVRB_4g091150 [Beta vulgaris subsp. vulgaris]|uniref:Oleosin n=1 Tax=Beta vulgaris subsp. vulgaris TaxID=3555 RepID=A0A0J8F9V4_BETVV|nr:hypothetical protein BVRB_4g091150 [Beta vulgaris subsp. vulgaris]
MATSDEQQHLRLIPISSSSTSTSNSYESGDHKNNDVKFGGRGLIMRIRRVVGATAAGAVVGGPLVVGMAITLVVSLSLAVVGIPVMLIFSPILLFGTFILVTAILGFSLAAVMALAGISTLNWVFQSIRHYDVDRKSIEEEEEEKKDDDNEDMAAKTLAQGWKREHRHHDQQQQEQEQEEAVGAEAEAEDEDEGEHEVEIEQEGMLGQQEEDVTTASAPSETTQHQVVPPTTTTTTTPATASDDTDQKKQQAQKMKRQRPPKRK